MRPRAIWMLALAATLVAPVAASAQSAPSYAVRDEAIHGTISGFDGKYALQVHDARGYTDSVVLHDGTVINPTGLRLATGMTVTIYGRTNGNVFAANEIDTPYRRTYAYGYPYYGYPYAYYGGYYGPGPYWGPGPYYGAHLGFWVR